MNKCSRRKELRDDTLATIEIASEMVRALYAELTAAIEEKDQEISTLRGYIRELESMLDSSGLDYEETDETKGSMPNAADFSGLAN